MTIIAESNDRGIAIAEIKAVLKLYKKITVPLLCYCWLLLILFYLSIIIFIIFFYLLFIMLLVFIIIKLNNIFPTSEITYQMISFKMSI